MITNSSFGSLKIEKLPSAGVPMRFNVQGFLATASGTPVTGNKAMTFKMFRDGGLFYSEEQSSVKCTLGIFNTIIGNSGGLHSADFENGNLWELVVQIDGIALNPPIEITSSVFAIKSTKSVMSDSVKYISGAQTARPITPQIGENEIANAAVTEAKINNSAVTAWKIQDDAITTLKIKDGNVQTPDIADLNVTNAKIGNEAISSYKIQDNAITTLKITDGAVQTPDIADLNVTNSKIGDAAISSYKIQNQAVTYDKLANPFYLTGIWNISGNGSNPAVYLLSSTRSVLGIQKTIDDNDYALYVNAAGSGSTADGIYTDGRLVAEGGKSTVVRTSRGKEALFCVESPEEEFYSNGTAQLKNGIVNITFDRLFNEAISSEIPVRVILTPIDSWSGMYVENVTKNSFVARSGAGDANAKFNWIAIGRRKGSETRPFVPIPSDEEIQQMGKSVNNNPNR